MRYIHFLGFLVLMFAGGVTLQAQGNCKVLVPGLQGFYKGGCKHGLAHGKGMAQGKDKYTGEFRKGYPDGSGTYVWADSSVYVGHWKKGKRFGVGTYSYKVDGHDTTIQGVWKNDKFIGKEERKPLVIVNKYVDSYEFENLGGTRGRVLIQFLQNGGYNNRISNVMVSANSGILTNRGQLIGFDNVNFPVIVTVRYDTWNKMGTRIINCYFEFEIFEPGDWIVRLKN
jgi:radial spoke head protein 1